MLVLDGLDCLRVAVDVFEVVVGGFRPFHDEFDLGRRNAPPFANHVLTPLKI